MAGPASERGISQAYDGSLENSPVIPRPVQMCTAKGGRIQKSFASRLGSLSTDSSGSAVRKGCDWPEALHPDLHPPPSCHRSLIASPPPPALCPLASSLSDCASQIRAGCDGDALRLSSHPRHQSQGLPTQGQGSERKSPLRRINGPPLRLTTTVGFRRRFQSPGAVQRFFKLRHRSF